MNLLITKSVLLLTLLGLSACSVNSDSFAPPLFAGAGSQEKISDQPLQGKMNGQDWKIQQAIGRVHADGMLMVSISGNGEVINCQYDMPLNPYVLFSVPLKVGEHKFDMLRPNSGYAATWVFKNSNGDIQNALSDIATISIDAIQGDRVTGGIFAKFLDLSSPGQLNGKFQITVCP